MGLYEGLRAKLDGGPSGGLEAITWDPGLSDDRRQSPGANRSVKRDRHGDGAGLVLGLHHDVTSALANLSNPWAARIWHTSSPERTRNLPNRDLELGNVDLAAQPSLHFVG